MTVLPEMATIASGSASSRARDCEQFTQVLEGDAARKRIVEESGGVLGPLSTPGTRITIIHPIAEVVTSIRKGQLLTAIEDTWWEIVQRDGAIISVANDDAPDQVAKIPEGFGGLPTTNQNKWRVYRVDNQTVPVGDQQYKVKHLHLLIPPQGHKLREEQLGIFVHRRGMQVGRLTIAGIRRRSPTGSSVTSSWTSPSKTPSQLARTRHTTASAT